VHVARVPTWISRLRDNVEDAMRREIAVTQFLHAQGAPVAAPATELPPGPHRHEGFAVSFWPFVEADPDRTVTAPDCAAMLPDLHREPPLRAEIARSAQQWRPSSPPALGHFAQSRRKRWSLPVVRGWPRGGWRPGNNRAARTRRCAISAQTVVATGGARLTSRRVGGRQQPSSLDQAVREVGARDGGYRDARLSIAARQLPAYPSSCGSVIGSPKASNNEYPKVVISATSSPSTRSTSSLKARNSVSP
jgi:hypothetical protein